MAKAQRRWRHVVRAAPPESMPDIFFLTMPRPLTVEVVDESHGSCCARGPNGCEIIAGPG
jgi:hypothetical protein